MKNQSLFLIFLLLLGVGCTETPLNNPYPAEEKTENILYSSFSERPKHLDPALSYSSNEITFTAQIYEPPFQYHYLKRPYTLIPLSAEAVPKPTYLDKANHPLPNDAPAEQIAFSLYEIEITPKIQYQPHPAFAKDSADQHLYHNMTPEQLDSVNALSDFTKTGSRELTAADFIHQIKRLAHPKKSSPIYGFMSEYIVGLKELEATLKQAAEQSPSDFRPSSISFVGRGRSGSLPTPAVLRAPICKPTASPMRRRFSILMSNTKTRWATR